MSILAFNNVSPSFIFRVGRRPVLLFSVIFILIFGLTVALSVNVTMFSTLRFFEGFCLAGIVLSLYALREYAFITRPNVSLLSTWFAVLWLPAFIKTDRTRIVWTEKALAWVLVRRCRDFRAVSLGCHRAICEAVWELISKVIRCFGFACCYLNLKITWVIAIRCSGSAFHLAVLSSVGDTPFCCLKQYVFWHFFRNCYYFQQGIPCPHVRIVKYSQNVGRSWSPFMKAFFYGVYFLWGLLLVCSISWVAGTWGKACK